MNSEQATFRDRAEGGRLLGENLKGRTLRDALVLGIPRGGAATGLALAQVIGAELDVVLSRKLRAPFQPEYAIGAISEDGRVTLNPEVAETTGVTPEYLEREKRHQLDEIARRRKLFRAVRPKAPIAGRSVIVTDDGIATGSTMIAALETVRMQKPHELILAVPVAPPERLAGMRSLCDEIVCLSTPADFQAVGQFYEDFSTVEDDEVVAMLREAVRERTQDRECRHEGSDSDPSREVVIALGPTHLQGTLQWSGKPRGVVVFAHGSGSSRHSPRNRFVADSLVKSGFATLLMDLLTEQEAADRDNVFDIALLADRLAGAAEWLGREPLTAELPVAYFGASTGSAAALISAASHPDRVAAIVSRGGRPDLAWDNLPNVHAPTLLIVGGDDEPVLTWNRDAFRQLTCTKNIAVIPGATHLFEEPGALEQVAELARDWLATHLAARCRTQSRP